MSHDITASVKSGDDAWTTVSEWNATYNYQPCLAACGLASFKALDGMSAAQAVDVLLRVRTELVLHPEHGDLIRGGGTWGDTDILLELIDRMVMTLSRHNYAKVSVS